MKYGIPTPFPLPYNIIHIFLKYPIFHAVFLHSDGFVPHLDRDVKGQAVDVVDVAQAEQAGEQPATQHAHRQVQPDGQALPDDATARAAALALALFHINSRYWRGATRYGGHNKVNDQLVTSLPEVHADGVGEQEGVVHGSQ